MVRWKAQVAGNEPRLVDLMTDPVPGDSLLLSSTDGPVMVHVVFRTIYASQVHPETAMSVRGVLHCVIDERG